jgi:hypothetical protein
LPPQTVTVVPVFVSSTLLDLDAERAAVRDAVLRLKQAQFVGMDYFGSRDETTREASLEEVDRSTAPSRLTNRPSQSRASSATA